MGRLDVSPAATQPRPYRSLRDDPRYAEIKKIIEDFPPENMERLRSYIKRWLSNQ